MLKCNFAFRVMCLSTFSHDAVRILASPESNAGGAPNCKTGELLTVKRASRSALSHGISKRIEKTCFYLCD